MTTPPRLRLSLAVAIAASLAACSEEGGGVGPGDQDDPDAVVADVADEGDPVDEPDLVEDAAADTASDSASPDAGTNDALSDAGDDTEADAATDLGDESAVDVDAGDADAAADPDVAGDPDATGDPDAAPDADAAGDVADDPDALVDTDGTDAPDVGDLDADTGPDLPDAPVYAPSCRPRTAGTPPSTELVLHSILPSNPWITDPVQLVALPDGTGRLVIVDQNGYVVITDAPVLPPDGTGVTTVDLWLDFSEEVDNSYFESGLLSLAFHPDFENNGEIFVNYTPAAPASGSSCWRTREIETVVSRFTVDETGFPDPDSEEILLEIPQPFENHNGGLVMFGPDDGYLYIGTGDGGSGGDPFGCGQRTDTLLGKLLRIDVDTTDPPRAYGIPIDNPFVDDAETLDEIYALGLRNPWRFSFDAVEGTLWLGDVGQGAWEEIDIIEAGGNYGWDVMEGELCFSSAPCDTTGLELPVHVYSHAIGNSVTGGFVYRGTRNEPLIGTYIFGDYGSGRIWRLQRDGDGGWQSELLRDTSILLSSFGEDADGELYVTNLAGGQVYWLEYVDDPGSPPAWRDQLSDTGCLDTAGAQLADGVLSYTVNLPFWSDGADKERGLALPNGALIGFEADAAWTFPDGTVLIKTFRLLGEPFETRLLTREGGEWLGASYRWSEDGTDATVVLDSLETDVAGQTWLFPSPEQCQACHTPAAGYLLGLRTPQLNTAHDVFDLGAAVNQIDALATVGYFMGDGPPSAASLPAFPALDDTSAPTAERARAYLDVNCSNCHRPDGPTPTPLDLQASTPLDEMAACDILPARGDLGIEDPLLIAPGIPDDSIVWRRLDTADEAVRMPPLGRYLTDETGSAVVRDWIGGLAGCE